MMSNNDRKQRKKKETKESGNTIETESNNSNSTNITNERKNEQKGEMNMERDEFTKKEAPNTHENVEVILNMDVENSSSIDRAEKDESVDTKEILFSTTSGRRVFNFSKFLRSFDFPQKEVFEDHLQDANFLMKNLRDRRTVLCENGNYSKTHNIKGYLTNACMPIQLDKDKNYAFRNSTKLPFMNPDQVSEQVEVINNVEQVTANVPSFISNEARIKVTRNNNIAEGNVIPYSYTERKPGRTESIKLNYLFKRKQYRTKRNINLHEIHNEEIIKTNIINLLEPFSGEQILAIFSTLLEDTSILEKLLDKTIAPLINKNRTTWNTKKLLNIAKAQQIFFNMGKDGTMPGYQKFITSFKSNEQIIALQALIFYIIISELSIYFDSYTTEEVLHKFDDMYVETVGGITHDFTSDMEDIFLKNKAVELLTDHLVEHCAKLRNDFAKECDSRDPIRFDYVLNAISTARRSFRELKKYQLTMASHVNIISALVITKIFNVHNVISIEFPEVLDDKRLDTLISVCNFVLPVITSPIWLRKACGISTTKEKSLSALSFVSSLLSNYAEYEFYPIIDFKNNYTIINHHNMLGELQSTIISRNAQQSLNAHPVNIEISPRDKFTIRRSTRKDNSSTSKYSNLLDSAVNIDKENNAEVSRVVDITNQVYNKIVSINEVEILKSMLEEGSTLTGVLDLDNIRKKKVLTASALSELDLLAISLNGGIVKIEAKRSLITALESEDGSPSMLESVLPTIIWDFNMPANRVVDSVAFNKVTQTYKYTYKYYEKNAQLNTTSAATYIAMFLENKKIDAFKGGSQYTVEDMSIPTLGIYKDVIYGNYENIGNLIDGRTILPVYVTDNNEQLEKNNDLYSNILSLNNVASCEGFTDFTELKGEVSRFSDYEFIMAQIGMSNMFNMTSLGNSYLLRDRNAIIYINRKLQLLKQCVNIKCQDIIANSNNMNSDDTYYASSIYYRNVIDVINEIIEPLNKSVDITEFSIRLSKEVEMISNGLMNDLISNGLSIERKDTTAIFKIILFAFILRNFLEISEDLVEFWSCLMYDLHKNKLITLTN